jgi:hypothetical protein
MVDMVVALSQKMADENTPIHTSDIKPIFESLITQNMALHGTSHFKLQVSDQVLEVAKKQFQARTDGLNANKKDENRLDAESSVKNFFSWIAVIICMQLSVDPACILNTDSTQKTLGAKADKETEKIHVPKTMSTKKKKTLASNVKKRTSLPQSIHLTMTIAQVVVGFYY